MVQPLPYLKETPSQTAGPYVHIGLIPHQAGFESLQPHGRQKKKLDDDFRGWGRTGTDFKSCLYTFETIKPGSVIARTGAKSMAPHINFWIVARGINIGLSTRMYFSDEAAANAADPVLNLIEQDTRRSTLIAQRSVRQGKVVYTFDIVLQGERETVFFDV